MEMKAAMIYPLWILLMLTIQATGTVQGQQCKRTNPKPWQFCVDSTCTTEKDCGKNETCLCDGDCGMSCIPNGLKCSPIRRVKKANVKKSGDGFRDAVEYSCRDGLTLRGSKKRTCRGIGKWDGRRTRCQRLCKDPGDIQFGNKNEDRRHYKVGSTITYWCFPNYEQEGNNVLKCTKSGKWQSPPPKCKLPSCSKPPIPPNARSRRKLKEKYRFNQIVVFECEYGYFVAGLRYQRCSNGGKWTSLSLRCIPKSCGDPGTPKNGRRRGYVFTFKKKVFYECNRGYVRIGPQFRQCQSNQKWSEDTPRCEPVDCGRLPTPNYGAKIEETKTTYLGRVSFKCKKTGYELKGSRQRVCQETGKWDGTLTRCEPVECADPGQPENGGRNPDLDKYVYENQIEYSCKTNHTLLEGHKSIICLDDKTWSGRVPKCFRPCSDPGIPIGGSRRDHSFLHDDKVSFSCKKGWKLEGEKTITCNNGQWDYRAPTCVEGCTKPIFSPNGGVRSPKDFYYDGEMIYMFCAWEYKLVGDRTARCRNGKWSSDPPSCKRICRRLQSPRRGWKYGTEFFEGKSVSFACWGGYDLIGQRTLKCLNTGQWNRDVPTCKRRCQYTRPANSRPSPNIAGRQPVSHRTSISFACVDEYTLDGAKSATCDDGRWRPAIPSCKAPCQDPGQIDNGYQTYSTSFAHKGQVTYGCGKGYSLDGKRRLFCDNGRWNNPKPSCKKWCGEPITPINGYARHGAPRPGSRVNYRCRQNTHLVGRASAICNDGQWSSPAPKCVEICRRIKKIANGRVKVNRNPTLSGDKVEFSCNKNYDLNGTTEIFCKKGKWNSTVPRCVGRCQVPSDISNIMSSVHLQFGEWLQSGTHIRFFCHQGTKLEGNNKINCNDGQWSDNFPKCKVPCKEPRNFASGTKRGDRFKLAFECNSGYSLVGSAVLNCVDGNWDSDTPKCYRDCPDIGVIIPNGKFLKNGFTHGQTISFQCVNGFGIKGSPTLTCKDGTWSDIIPTCIPVCSTLGHPIYGQRLDDNFYNGSTVRFGCRHGFSRRGPQSVTCINGNWSGKAPVCKANCPDPGIPGNGQRIGDVFTHLATVQFSCKKTLTMIGPSKITCDNGKWTNVKPDCTECGSPLGMEKNIIPDKNIGASSFWKRGREARNGRLNGRSAWCSWHLNRKPYLEVELDFPHKITYIATQGSERDNTWVEKYTISHTLAKYSFVEYRENNRERAFTGNTDSTSVVKHKLENPFIARKVRFHPIGQSLVRNMFKRACMRVEIYGCSLPTNCVMARSRVLGKWSTSYRGADIYYKSYVKTINDEDDEIQVDLEDESQHSYKFKFLSKNEVVLNIPNKQLDLPINTRVLAMWKNIYYTGYIQYKTKIHYGVRADDNDFKWFNKDQIRVLKPAQLCKG